MLKLNWSFVKVAKHQLRRRPGFLTWFYGFIGSRGQRSTMATLETLAFDNLVLRSLPIDTNKENYGRQVAGACFSLVQPTTVERPQLVAYSADAMALLDLPESELRRPEFAKYFSGNEILPGSETASHCYCGHQFGSFSGQLGDGAAIYLGEVVNKKGQRWEFQLKGAGKTPYSRQADGRKVLRSSIREFLCSEAMHYLGIPTTRAGACITSDTQVIRDIFYNGNPIQERASVVTRIAPTFLRFGSFEIFKTQDENTGRHGPSVGRYEILNKMLDYSISTFYPEIDQQFSSDKTAKYKAFYGEVVARTAAVVAEWQCVGFCHGVLNTDNMSIMGLTIDYGPFGFLDYFNPHHICNASDDGGRYTYVKQPAICKWNLQKFAEALVPELPLAESLPELNNYDAIYKDYYLAKMRKKLGLLRKALPEDEILVEDFLNTLEATCADFTNCFRGLNKLTVPNSKDHKASSEVLLQYLLSQSASLEEMITAWSGGMEENQFDFLVMLMNMQPELMECLGKEVSSIKREIERRKKIEELEAMDETDKQNADKKHWETWLKKYIDRLKLEVEDVSDVESFNKERTSAMNDCNPSIVLRNYIAQNAISKAENGDFSEVTRVLDVLKKPFSDVKEISLTHASSSKEPTRSEDAGHETFASYTCRPPEWAFSLKVS